MVTNRYDTNDRSSAIHLIFSQPTSSTRSRQTASRNVSHIPSIDRTCVLELPLIPLAELANVTGAANHFTLGQLCKLFAQLKITYIISYPVKIFEIPSYMSGGY